MKITLDIPNTTLCAFVSYVLVNEDTYGMAMNVECLSSDDLFNGNEIKIEPYKESDPE